MMYVQPSGFSVCGPMAWNSPPDNLHDSSCSSDSFRHSIKTTFLLGVNVLNAVERLHEIALYKLTIDIHIDIMLLVVVCTCVLVCVGFVKYYDAEQ